MKKAVGVVGDNFNTIRTGRANPAILDKVMASTPPCKCAKSDVVCSICIAGDSAGAAVRVLLWHRFVIKHKLSQPCLPVHESNQRVASQLGHAAPL